MRLATSLLALALTLGSASCTSDRVRYPSTDGGLRLDRVVLYRNGIGYFERLGEVDGNVLTIKVRKDQVNDLLKSLTVVEKEGGKAVSVSMPLDPQSWANAALATLAPGRGNLAEVLDALRGTRVTLSTTEGSLSGRIVMVEQLFDAPVEPMRGGAMLPPEPAQRDHRITLIDGNDMKVVRLSKVKGVKFEDGDLAMQLNRTLDASAGEGMFQQVEIAIRLAGANSHQLLVSYVVSAPMWKPTYRVVLPKDKKGKALLQGWAVVDNTSGEEWNDVSLGLTSGAPIAFRYDLHTPRDVDRTDLTESGVRKQAQAMIGETSYGGEDDEADKAMEPAAPMAAPAPGTITLGDASGEAGPMGGAARAVTKSESARDYKKGSKDAEGRYAGKPKPDVSGQDRLREERQTLDFDSLRRSTLAQAKAQSVSGLNRFDIEGRVTVPEGTSTMVAIINGEVEGEETFLFKPGGAGMGYEANPYRVVRFKNQTPFVLEPGPISIYAGGSFVGEGLSDVVGTGVSATIPFAVETGIMVSSTSKYDGDEMRLIKISRGVLEVESFGRRVTTYTVKSQSMNEGFKVLVRHPKAGWNYELSQKPEGTEDLPDGYLVPVIVGSGTREGAVTVTEQTPSRREISIWDQQALPVLEKLFVATDLLPEARTRLQPIIDRRREIGRIDDQLEGMRRQRDVNDQRANEARQNLEKIAKDAQAGALRQKLTKRLEEFTEEGNRLGRDMAELERQRMEKRIELEDALQDLDLTAPPAKKDKSGDKTGAAPAPAPAPVPMPPALPAGAAPATPAPAGAPKPKATPPAKPPVAPKPATPAAPKPATPKPSAPKP